LARVLGALDEERERANELAKEAERGLAAAGERRREDLEEVREWLRGRASVTRR
jgi:hypothetical protein